MSINSEAKVVVNLPHGIFFQVLPLMDGCVIGLAVINYMTDLYNHNLLIINMRGYFRASSGVTVTFIKPLYAS